MLTNVYTFIIRILDFIERALLSFGALLTGSFTLVVFTQVLMRFVIKHSLPWTEEVSRFLFIWMIFIGATIGVRRLLHYQIRILTDHLPRSFQKLANIIVSLLTVLIFYLICIYSLNFHDVIKSNIAPATQISMGIPYVAVILFGFAGLIFSIENLFKSVYDLIKSEH